MYFTGRLFHYDCLLMFSGGKDSIYMLNKLVTEDKLFGDNLTLFYNENDLNKIPKLIFPYAEYGDYNKDNVTFEEKTYRKSVIEEHGLVSQQQYENTYDSVIRLFETANELELDLNKISKPIKE